MTAVQALATITRSRWIRVGFVAVAFALLIGALAGRWNDVRGTIAELGPPRIASAFVLGLGGSYVAGCMWWVVLRGYREEVAFFTTLRLFGASLLGKYVPGTVWTTVMQAEIAATQRLPRRHGVAASLVAMAVGLVTGALCGLVLVPAALQQGGVSVWWLLLVAPLVVLLASPRLLNRLIDKSLTVLSRDQLERPIHGRVVALCALWGLAHWLVMGLHLFVLVSRFDGGRASTYVYCVGAFALAWTLGFLVVVAPAGAGVRDVVLVALLSRRLTQDEAVAVAIVSRFLLTSADLLAGALGVAAVRAGRRSSLPG